VDDQFQKKSAFTAHLAVKHGRLSAANVDHTLYNRFDNSCRIDCTDASNAEVTDAGIKPHFAEDDLPDDSDNMNEDTFVRNLSLFLLKLQSRYSVPMSTVDVIASEMINCMN
jgi:hypothetical protein